MSTFSPKAPLIGFTSESFEHEQVVLHHDPASGLKSVVAIHSTALGPALGGARFHPYNSDEEAITDALNLSRGMSYKNAMAGLDFGGGKAIVVGDPAEAKTAELLLAFGRLVNSLGGRYITACDAGTCVTDMDVVARECRWTLTRSSETGGAGDPSIATALGVLQGMRAAALHRWGTPSLQGRTVGVAGLGKVGHRLVEHLFNEGARVVVTDVRQEPLRHIAEKFPRIGIIDNTENLVRFRGMDIYAPCALGGALDDDVAREITADVVCGAANNQLAHTGIESLLAERGTLYLPDYVVNAGGAIQATGELRGLTPGQTMVRVEKIFDTALTVLEHAQTEGILPGVAADRIAEQRIAAASGARVKGTGPSRNSQEGRDDTGWQRKR
ncbi:Leu/Phe/Val dehydrogenase [Streptomyces zagrosensis]|uniref:Valine dehydrogenase n=1 Tax=Streptomyces zagrosensis TaxID=1042984 RepID=A0A7W9Q9R8_9ACTN|nr:Glu/Leu/Phe/Val dehydrogenase [Streptomyces zagrosensis]MBB5936235.1 valine dehydrogenase (NAD+) [Streptomyces zagrosensis]